MNHLLHLYLVDPLPDARLGALIGDYIKGRLDRNLPAGVLQGIIHHRRLDSFAQTSAAFRRSKQRLNPDLGLCRGILVDIAYDHFLAQNWRIYHSQPLEQFAASIYRLVKDNPNLLPNALRRQLPRMLAANWLVSLRHLDHIEIILQRLSRRLSRANLLADGTKQLMRHRQGLEADFSAFMMETQLFFHPVPISHPGILH